MEYDRTIREALRESLEKSEEKYLDIIPLPVTYTIRGLAAILYWNACNWAEKPISTEIMDNFIGFEGALRMNVLLEEFLKDWLDKPAKPDPGIDGPCWYDVETIIEKYNEHVRKKL